MSRISFAILFFGVIFAASTSVAQDNRKPTATTATAAKSSKFGTHRHEARSFRSRLFGRRSTPRASFLTSPREFKSRPSYPMDLSPHPKFIGGFHSSHFSNIGIPNGDIGFRGNGIYWAPW